MRFLLVAFTLGLAIAPTRRAVAQSAAAPRSFADLDANGDGTATAEEAGTEQARFFSRLLQLGDKNGDGQLSAEEYAAVFAPAGGAADRLRPDVTNRPDATSSRDALVLLLAKMDANADGRIVADEVPRELHSFFSILIERSDADKNRELDAVEIQRQSPLLESLAGAIAARMKLDVLTELAALPPERRQAIEAIVPGLDPAAQAIQAAGQTATLRAFDANGDGVVGVDEAVGQLSELVERADADHDQKLSAPELQRLSLLLLDRRFVQQPPREAAAVPTGAAAVPAQAGDRVQVLLARLDANGDGQISREEFPAQLARAFEPFDRDANGMADATELAEFMKSMERSRPPAGGNQPLGASEKP